MTSWHLLVPSKGTPGAKSRTELPVADRLSLAAAMLADVVSAARDCPAVATIHVVTADEQAAQWALAAGAGRYRPSEAMGLNAELAEAAAAVAPEDGVAIVLGDLPCLTGGILASLLAGASGERQSFVADLAGTGTTTLLAPPGVALEPRFGPGSAQRHGEVGVEFGARAPRGARRDVDTVADLIDAVDLGVGPHTREWMVDVTCLRRLESRSLAH